MINDTIGFWLDVATWVLQAIAAIGLVALLLAMLSTLRRRRTEHERQAQALRRRADHQVGKRLRVISSRK